MSLPEGGLPILVAVMGPTASGKTALAETLADRLDAQLLNADAFQAYVGMDVGTAKPAQKERYRLLDLKRPDEPFGVGEYCLLAAGVLAETFAQGRSAVVVGGTGQYVRALFEEFDDLMPEPDAALRDRYVARLQREGLPVLATELQARDPGLAARTDLRNPVRVTRALERLDDTRAPLRFKVPYTKKVKLATDGTRDHLQARIAHRTREMMHNGWVEEVRRLRAEGYGPGDPGFRAIGYRTIANLIDGDLATEEAERAIVQETAAYAKRQRTWLRSEPGLHSVAGSPSECFEEALAWVGRATLEM